MIALHSDIPISVTVVPNIFIDHFMPAANGSYVKVYLYLLRYLYSDNSALSISSIADHLEDTEKDIIRALHYWEKTGLLSLQTTASGQISDITLQDFSPSLEAASPDSTKKAQEETAAARVSVKEDKPDFIRPTYTPAQIEQMTQNDKIKWMLNIIEIYLQRLLKPADIQLILYLYESLNFSAELIMYLYEYCVSRNKKNPSYIEAVAMSWVEEGIDTVEKAEAASASYNSHYNAVNKAFGLNRSPGEVERKYINKWVNQYGFPIVLIVEACNRTILRTQKPDFKYADKILSNWYSHHVKTIDDVKELDKQHHKENTAVSSAKTAPPKTSQNRFNAFPQRSYSKEEYSAMEQKLLKKQ